MFFPLPIYLIVDYSPKRGTGCVLPYNNYHAIRTKSLARLHCALNRTFWRIWWRRLARCGGWWRRRHWKGIWNALVNSHTVIVSRVIIPHWERPNSTVPNIPNFRRIGAVLRIIVTNISQVIGCFDQTLIPIKPNNVMYLAYFLQNRMVSVPF